MVGKKRGVGCGLVLAMLLVAGATLYACATAPEISPVGWILIVGLYVLARHLGTIETKRRELEAFEWSDGGVPYETVIQVNFPNMMLRVKGHWTDYAEPPPAPELHHIRRNPNGVWECCLSNETRQARIKDCTERLLANDWTLDLRMNAGTPGSRDGCKLRLEEAQKNDWAELDQHLQSIIEVRYKMLTNG